MKIKVIELRAAADLRWDFEPPGTPFFLVKSGDYDRRELVDPVPAYPHDAETVRVEAERAAAAFSVGRDVAYYLTDRESLSRSNGWTNISFFYEGKDEKTDERPWDASIVLCGKRIPIHPAMTRYLVSHEYGHVVSKFLRWKRGEKDHEVKMYAEYQKLRGFVSNSHYGAGTWHARVEELFANDFRILVVGAEKEFWPHPGFPRPEGLPEVVKFWEDAKKEAIV